MLSEGALLSSFCPLVPYFGFLVIGAGWGQEWGDASLNKNEIALTISPLLEKGGRGAVSWPAVK